MSRGGGIFAPYVFNNLQGAGGIFVNQAGFWRLSELLNLRIDSATKFRRLNGKSDASICFSLPDD